MYGPSTSTCVYSLETCSNVERSLSLVCVHLRISKGTSGRDRVSLCCERGVRSVCFWRRYHETVGQFEVDVLQYGSMTIRPCSGYYRVGEESIAGIFRHAFEFLV